MFEAIAVFAIVLIAIVVYYETRIARIFRQTSNFETRYYTMRDLKNQWKRRARELEAELCDLKLQYGHAITAEKIASGKVKARNIEKSKTYAIALPGFTMPNGDHELKFDNDGALIFERKPKTENKAQSNGDKSKTENGNKNQPAPAKSESFEHKNYQTVVNQLGGSVSEVESKSIKSQLDKNNDVKVIVGNIKKWRENNAKKIANSK